MKEGLKKELRELYHSFDKTNNFYEKGYIISFFDYLKNVFPNDLDIIKMNRDLIYKMNLYSDYFTKYSEFRGKKIDKFVKKKTVFFDRRITKDNKEFKLINGTLIPLGKDNIAYLIETFLGSIDKDLLEFYRKINSEGRITFSPENITAFTSLSNSNTMIFIEKLENLKDIMILMHEIGHAYYFYINNMKISERENVLSELKDEIPAKVLEIKFVKFLQNNGVFEQGLVLESLFDEIIEECNKKRDNYDNLKYLIASSIAKSVKDKEFDLAKYYKHIYKSDAYNLVNEIVDDRKLGRVLGR